MIRLINGNVERVVSDEANAQKLQGDGFRRMGPNAGSKPTPGGKSLADMTVEELKALAKDRKIAGYGALNKDDLLAILEENGHDGTGKAENPDE